MKFGGSEARPHLLAEIITLDRQEERVLLVRGDCEFSRGNQISSFYSNTPSKQPPVFIRGRSSTFIKLGNWPISCSCKYPVMNQVVSNCQSASLYSENRMPSNK